MSKILVGSGKPLTRNISVINVRFGKRQVKMINIKY